MTFDEWWELNRDEMIADTDPRRHCEAAWRASIADAAEPDVYNRRLRRQLEQEWSEVQKLKAANSASIADTAAASEELEKCAGCTARCTNDPPDCYASGGQNADTAGAISDDHAHKLWQLARLVGSRDWIKEFRKSIAATPASSVADDPTLIELLRNVCRYADSVCGMLRQGGWPGKAEALEARIKAVIDHDAASAPSVADTAGAKPSQDWIDGFSQGKIAARQSAATPARSVADAAGAEKDAKRWRYAYKHLIIGTQDTRNGFEEIDIEAIDAAIAKESGNDLE
jgi:hypothetical protein